MNAIETILMLYVAVAALAYAARRLAIPYPLLLVVGGLALSRVPNLPHVALEPNYVFLVFLPPLLYNAARLTSWRDFVFNLRPITLLAVGLTLFTTVAVAAVAHWLLAFEWAPAFVLGAIVSPPDAIAATAVAERLRVPRRIVTILEGESLINDAIALVAYRFAVAATMSGHFSLPAATGQFVVAAIGGIAVGLAVGFIVAYLRPRIHDEPVEGLISLLTAYMAYLPAERLHVSGVLAAVTCGLYVARRIPHITTPTMRLRANAVWDLVTFLLNGLVFILIGFALQEILESLGPIPLPRLVAYAILISATAILVRVIWVVPAVYLPRWLSASLRKRDPVPPVGWIAIIAWTGMRGIVSLAAALALPTHLPGGAPFPHRPLILFLTFCVILATLLLQGLSLPLLIRAFNVIDEHEEERDEETAARYLTALAAIERLDLLSSNDHAPDDIVRRIRSTYDNRLGYYSGRLADPASDDVPEFCDTEEKVRREALHAERKMLVKLRDDGVIGDDILRRIGNELDLEESRLDSE
jgi:CPA1 family monovalent cation:H+ antiporter